jgi:hypothetical protein
MAKEQVWHGWYAANEGSVKSNPTLMTTDENEVALWLLRGTMVVIKVVDGAWVRIYHPALGR